MYPISIANMKKTPDFGVFMIDRSTPLGNPYRIGIDGDRETVIAKYEKYLDSELERGDGPVYEAFEDLLSEYKARRGIVLGCWCAPEPCHGTVLKNRLIRWHNFDL